MSPNYPSTGICLVARTFCAIVLNHFLGKEINNGTVKDYVYNNLNQLVAWSSGGTGTPTRLVTVTGTAFDDELVSVFVNQTEASLNAQTYTAEVLFTVGDPS